MIQNSADIDRIVREVLAEMGLLPKAPAKRGAAGGGSESSALEETEARVETAARNGDVVVDRRVVTLSTVIERLGTARRLIVPPRAVVTPSVRDELRRRKIALVFEERRLRDSARTDRAYLAVVGSRIDPGPALEELSKLGIETEMQRFDCLIKVTDEMARLLADGLTAGIILSNHGATGAALANRHRKVRAILASEESRAAADAASVGANLLIIEPRATPVATVRQLIGNFCRNGPWECPEVLKDRLD